MHSSSAIGYADPVAVMGTSGRMIEAVFLILRFGGDGVWIGLSIMADIDHNCMKRCDSREMCMASFLMYPVNLPEHAGG